jgi:hypothetical protein
MKTAWLSLLAFGIAGSIATACTITTTDGDNLGGSFNDTGGSTAKGGTGAGGTTSKGGTTAAGGTAAGGSATGGFTSSGGAASTDPVVKCDTATVTQGTPQPTCDFAAPDNTFCHECLSKKPACCTAVKQCYGFGPGTVANQCAFGGPDGGSEYACFEGCMVLKTKAGAGEWTAADVDACSAMCVTPGCDAFPGNATNDLIACITTDCEKECLLDPAKL